MQNAAHVMQNVPPLVTLNGAKNLAPQGKPGTILNAVKDLPSGHRPAFAHAGSPPAVIVES